MRIGGTGVRGFSSRNTRMKISVGVSKKSEAWTLGAASTSSCACMESAYQHSKARVAIFERACSAHPPVQRPLPLHWKIQERNIVHSQDQCARVLYPGAT